MIVDIHGHLTTAPTELMGYRARQIASSNKPVPATISFSDDSVRASVQGHLEQMKVRGIDKVFLSPTAAAMGHHFGGELISRYWTEVNNDLIAHVCSLYPDHFVPVCQLPQSPGVSPANCLEELERCVVEMGFVGCNINPDVSGGAQPFTPSLGDRWWRPLWEKMVELQVPGMIHASATVNPAMHLNGAQYVAQDTAAAVELCMSRVFEDFPTLVLIIPHGGGSIPYQFNRNRALHERDGLPPFEEAAKKLYFDTCVYDADSLEMLIRKMGIENVLFGSEMFGTARSIDPQTGLAFDDNVPMIKAISSLSNEAKEEIFVGNARRLFPRAEKGLKE